MYPRRETRKRKMESSENAKQPLTYTEELKVHSIFFTINYPFWTRDTKKKKETRKFYLTEESLGIFILLNFNFSFANQVWYHKLVKNEHLVR